MSKIDLKKGFYQMPVQKENQHKTSFYMPWGKYAFTRMPFGLKNVPATFQQCMDKVLHGQAGFSSTYIDDVLIISNTWEDHVEHIRGVLENSAKHEWGANALTYLGYEVGLGKIKIPEAMVKAIRDYKRPYTKKGLHAFLGTTGYYWRYISDFSMRAGPLYDALRKVSPNTLVWDEVMVDAFQYLIDTLTSFHVLWLPQEGNHSVVHRDASYKGLGTALSAERDGIQRPIGFYSKKLLPMERNYTSTEMECLAVHKSIYNFAIHLVGIYFDIVTDHRALTSLLTSMKLNKRLMRWALALQVFDFSISHHSRASHQNADGLSRQEWYLTDTADPTGDPTIGKGEILGSASNIFIV